MPPQTQRPPDLDANERPAPQSTRPPDVDAPGQPDFQSTNAKDANGNPVVREVGDFLGEATQGINPLNWNRALQAAFWHPIDTATGMIAAQDQVRQQAQNAFQTGDYVTGFAKTLDWLIPVLGPRLSQAGDYLQEGRIGKGLGASVDVAGQVVLPKALSNLPNAASLRLASRNRNPLEAAAVQFGEARGIPVDAATATGSNFVKGVQQRATNSMGGANIAEGFRAKQANAFQRVGDELAGELNAPAPGVRGPMTDPLRASARVSEAIDKKLRAFDAEANTAYDALRTIEADPKHAKSVQVGTRDVPETVASGAMDASGRPITSTRVRREPVMETIALPVDLRGVKTALTPIYDRLTRVYPIAQRQASAGYQAIENIVHGPDYAPLSIADDGLSAIKAVARGADMPELRNTSQGLAAEAVKQLDTQVRRTAAQAGPDALRALDRGRKATTNKYDVAAVRDLFSTGAQAEPRKLFNELTAKRDGGLERLNHVARIAPDEIPNVGRALLQDMLDTATEAGAFQHTDKLWADWQKLGPQTKRILFGPNTQNLDRFFLLAKKANERPNTSGTAQVLTALNVTSAPLTWTLAKILYSPKAAQAMTRGLSLSLGPSMTAAKRTAITADVMRAVREAGLVPAAAEDRAPSTPSQ